MRHVCSILALVFIFMAGPVRAESCPVGVPGSSAEAKDYLGASPDEIAILGRRTFHSNIAVIEQALNARGTVLPQQGMVTTQLRQALVAFQESVGIEASGDITRETIEKLGAKLQSPQ